MRKFTIFSFTAIALAAVAFMDGDAQPPGKKGGFGGFGKGGGRSVTAAQIVERIMSYDKNGDGKVTVDELPERMQHLVAMGDTNKDGALDRDEVRKLADTLEAFVGLTGGGLQGGGFGGPKGDKGGPKGPDVVRRAVDDLELPRATRDSADKLVRAYTDKLKKYEEVSRAELVMQMKDVLSEGDYRTFKAALDRPPPPKGGFKGQGGGGGAAQGDLNARIDQIQKELEDLRRKVQK